MSNITIKDVARECGVSVATVSRVLNNKGYASEKIKQKVLATVKELNYQPNGIARSLKIEHTNIIGIIIPDISNNYFMKISKGIEDTVNPESYNLIFCSSEESVSKEQELLLLLYKKRVDAIVLATTGGNEELIDIINQSGIPVVLIDRKLNHTNHEIDTIQEDNVKGAYELTKHVILQNHKRIGVVNGPFDVSTGIDRYKGFINAMNEFGITEQPELVFNGAFTEESGRKAAKYFISLKDNRPTAILSFNNTMTYGIIFELYKRGCDIRQDMKVASYGEVEVAELVAPSMVSIKQCPFRMGKKVGEILMKRLIKNQAGPFNVLFEPELINI